MIKQSIFIPIGLVFMILAFTIHGDFPDRWVPILSIITLSLLYAGILMLAYGIYFGIIALRITRLRCKDKRGSGFKRQ